MTMIDDNRKMPFLAGRLTTVLLTVMLVGCAALKNEVELPENDGDGLDRMKSSPCACIEHPYAPPRRYDEPEAGLS